MLPSAAFNQNHDIEILSSCTTVSILICALNSGRAPCVVRVDW